MTTRTSPDPQAAPGQDLLPARREPANLELAGGVLHGEVLDPPATSPVPAAPAPARLELDRYLAAHPPPPGADLGRLTELVADVGRYAQASRSKATISKYDTGWAALTAWCAEFGFDPGPPTDIEVVALYLAHMAREELAISTQDGRLAAIRDRHLDAGLLPPTDDARFRRIRDGVRRVHGRPTEGKAAVSITLLQAMLAARSAEPAPTPAALLAERRKHLGALRDRCLLTVGFFAGLRRKELAGLPVDHLQLTENGLRLLVARSKADQTGTGRRIDLPWAPDELAWLCPVRNTLAWLDTAGRREHLHSNGRHRSGTVPLLSGITPGARVRSTPLSDLYVAKTVKDTAAEAGQPPEVVDTLAGHSLRAGFATAAEAAGVSSAVISRVLGHHTGVTGRYIRHTFDGSAQQAVYKLALATLGGPAR